MPKVSVILPTARGDFPMVDRPETHLFEPTTKSLAAQEFADFELIVVDALHRHRADYFRQHPQPFPVVHVPPKPNPWHARKLWGVCTQFNTGLLHARGELVVTVGDCSQLPPHLLRRFWEVHQDGYLCQALMRYYKGGKQLIYDSEAVEWYARQKGGTTPDEVERHLAAIYRYGEPIVDTRLRFVEAAGGRMEGRMDQWWYGYGAAPLEAYLAVNGFDEAFDGSKSLEDCDLGSRFAMAGFGKLLLARDIWAVEYAHDLVSPEVWDPALKAMKCNYAILLWNRRARRVRANAGPLSPEALEFIKQTTRGSECSRTGGAEYDLGEAFDWWAANIPAFDLRKEREAVLRASSA